MSLFFSVIICTYNRADLLAGALQSLCSQGFDPSRYEIIVVDNNSADETRKVTEEFALCQPNIRYCLETQQGLSYARNRGWREARGGYVGYLDDDGLAGDTWLLAAEDIIARIRPGAFGGPYFAFYNSPKPRWYKDEYGSSVQGNQPHLLQSQEYLSGGNLFIRRDLLDVIGGFNPQLGMTGGAMGYGEETEWLIRLRAEQPDEILYYDPRVWIRHLVRTNKMTRQWILRRHFTDGRYFQRVWPYQHSVIGWIVRIIYFSLAVPLDICYGALARDRRRYPFLENYIYEHTRKFLQRLGVLYEQRCKLFGLQ